MDDRDDQAHMAPGERGLVVCKKALFDARYGNEEEEGHEKEIEKHVSFV
jgi:hypothetical protein